MKILVIGSGGREHALAWRLAQGTAREEGVENIALTAIPDLIAFAQREQIYFMVVGPEAHLAAGVVDNFRAAGLRIFGSDASSRAIRKLQGFRQSVYAAT